MVTVRLTNNLAPFLVSVYDINFTIGDGVTTMAQNVCKSSKSNAKKVRQIHTYVYENIRYNNYLANAIVAGEIKTYIPNPITVLTTGRGVCYDRASLFAAMCRSQRIPCTIEKGYVNGVYHAWNKVYVNNRWYEIDAAKSPSKYSY